MMEWAEQLHFFAMIHDQRVLLYDFYVRISERLFGDAHLNITLKEMVQCK